jgi:hypothetical protein
MASEGEPLQYVILIATNIEGIYVYMYVVMRALHTVGEVDVR